MSAPSEPHHKSPPSPQPAPSADVTDGSNIPASDSEPEGEGESDHLPAAADPSTSTTLLIDPSYRSARITNFATGQHLYDIALHSISKPHVVITAAVPTTNEDKIGGDSDGKDKGDEVASITFHPFARHITLNFSSPSYETKIEHKGIFKSGYIYTSPAFGNQQLEWKGGADAVLVDAKGEAVARMESHRMQAWRKRKVEVLSREEAVVREVLVSAVAVMEVRRRRSRNSGGGGGGAP